MQKPVIATLLLFILGTLWGSGYSIARYATTHGVPPLGYAFWQSLGPSIFLLLLCFISKSSISLSKNLLVFYLITGLVGIAIPNSNMYFVAPHLPAGLVALLVNTVPIITYVITLTLAQERFSLLRFLGVLLGFCGMLIIFVPHLSIPNMSTLPWAFLLLVSPLCFSICAIYASSYATGQHNTMMLAAGMLWAATLLLTPLVWLSHNFYYFNWPFQTADWLIFLEIVLSSLGYVLFFQLLKYAGPVYYSLVGGIVMLTGLIWGWIIFGEKLNFWTSIAAFLILFGVCLVTLGQRIRK